MRYALSIGNGLYSTLQGYGQIQLMEKIMAVPFEEPTSWLHAMRTAQHEKWDVMDAAFAVCEAAGVVKRTAEQQIYFGAYIFGHMMPRYSGYSIDIGGASNDFFKTVVGYDHFNYNWGWRGSDPQTYGNGVATNVTKYDFVRIHVFRGYVAYQEEARRMRLVCSDKNSRVAPQYLSINEWSALREADLIGRRSRKLSAITDMPERAKMVKELVPRMSHVDAMKHAALSSFGEPTEYEYGLPTDLIV